MPTWPNFFIAGAPKAGTTSLHAYLQAMPGIYMSRIKEPNYFSRVVIPDDHPARPIRDDRQYLQLFAEAGTASIVGEASPTYLADPDAPILINSASPGARIVVSLRDPVERAYSHYLMMLNNGRAKGSFLEEIKKGLAQQHNRSIALLRPDVGLYYEQVRRFKDVFGEDRLKVLVFEELMADIPATLRQVLAFLGIDHPVDNFTAPVYRQFSSARGPLVRYLFGNRTIAVASEALISPRLRKLIRDKFLVKQVAKPQMDPEARDFLTQFYADDVVRLVGLLGRPLPWRNFPDAGQSSSR